MEAIFIMGGLLFGVIGIGIYMMRNQLKELEAPKEDFYHRLKRKDLPL